MIFWNRVLEMGYRDRDSARGEFGSLKRVKRRKIDWGKVAVIAAATGAVVVGGYGVYSHLPFVKVNKAIAAGDRYSEKAEYDAAISSYSEALMIDSGAVSAYSNMASAYLSIDDSESAKKVLYDGWQNTENETLRNNYLTVILNDAVNSMNAGEGSVDTVLSVISVVEEDSDSQEALQILEAAYDRCFKEYVTDVNGLFRNDENGCTFAKYQEIVNRLLAVYEANPSDELKSVLVKYIAPPTDSFTMNYEDAISYSELAAKAVSLVGECEAADSFVQCVDNAKDVQAVFADIFSQLDIGNVDELRDFIVTDEYIALRDVFLNHEETPQENTTYVPISREAVIFNLKDGAYTYRFLDFEENPETEGVITLWANFFEDDGVQRTSISYEPKSPEGSMYPHTKYSVTYLKSYTTKGKSTKVAKMNYRLSTAITDENGDISETIVGDWGGPDEWIMDIDTIESRIRA